MQIVGILVEGKWQCEHCFRPVLWGPVEERILSALRLDCNGLVDGLAFRLVCDGEGVGKSSSGEKP